jgi:N-acetylglucosaminyl-diphospho-decaprenol L-rhamnosyltransferase
MLASLTSASSSPFVGVIADNRPNPAVKAIAHAANFTYIKLSNRGYGAAINAAARTLPSTVRWILVSNPDVVFRPGAIDAMIDVAQNDDSVGEVGPRILDADGSVYPSARAIPSLRMGIGHAIFGRVWRSNPWTRRYLQNESLGSDEIRAVGWLSGACLLLRRAAFDTIGGFDETYFMYFEDIDIAYRLSKAGYNNIYAPTAEIVHTGAHSTESDSGEMIDAHHRSARIFISQRYPGVALSPLRLALGIGLRVRASIDRAAKHT